MAGFEFGPMARLFLTSLLVLSACASRQYENDKHDAAYHSGKYSGVPTGVGQVSTSNSSGDAVVGLVASVANLAANRDYYSSNAITGKVVCNHLKTGNIEIPCGRVTVLLNSEEGKELARVDSGNGGFAFKVERNVGYLLSIESEKYRIQSPHDRMVYLGDDLVVSLEAKPAK